MSNNLELIIDSREQRLYDDITSRDLDVYTNKVNILSEFIEGSIFSCISLYKAISQNLQLWV